MTQPVTRRIDEFVVPGQRLGRHVNHDPRSLNYLVTQSSTIITKRWARRTPILDQGDLGSCTGNAATAALGSDPLLLALAAKIKAGLVLDEAEAVRLYTAATRLDGYPGSYPPDDTGSDGLSVAKAAKNAGLISGYTHATSLAAMNSALQKGPVIVGINWYDSFDVPNPNSGLVAISPNAVVRGGHEVCIRVTDVEHRLFGGDNSWSPGWGIQGRFEFSWDTMDRLFGEQGDCTQFAPAAPSKSGGLIDRLMRWIRV